MKAVIKSGDDVQAVAVRSFHGLIGDADRPQSGEDSEQRRLREQIATLEAAVRTYASDLEREREESSRAFARGEAQGRQKGMAEADERFSERLTLLTAGLEKAHRELTAGLASLERLAALLARDGLALILGDPGDRAAMLSDIIRTQCAKIERQAVLGVRLSIQDFPDRVGLDGLAERLGLAGLDISASDALATGACVMELRLGEIVVGIDQQWTALRTEYEAMASVGGRV